jgi:TonB family protein
MQALLIHLLQANLILMLLFGYYFLVLRRENSFRFNRFFLLAVWPLSLLLPAVKLPQWSSLAVPTADDFLFLLAQNDLTWATSETTAVAIEKPTVMWPIVLLALIVLGSVFIIIQLAKRLFFIEQLPKRHGYRTERKSDHTLVYTAGELPIFSFFERIFWHEQTHLDKQQNEAILSHELVHVKQKHSWDVVISEAFLCIFWYNPLAWLLKRAIADNHEYLADQASASQLADEGYRALLAGQFAQQYNLSLGNFFYKSTLINRIMMLSKQKQTAKWKLAMAAPFLVVLVIGFGRETSLTGFKSDDLDANVEVSKDTDEVFSIVEEQAVPKNGIESFYEYVAKELGDKYPKDAQRMGIEGTVYVQFIIEKDGSLSDVQVVRGIGGGCDEMAVEVISNSEKWIPGRQAGLDVRSRRIIPIKFVLGDNKEASDNSKRKTYTISSNDEIFTQVDKQAEPMNGIIGFYEHILAATQQYPAQAKSLGIEGTVYVQFVVEKDGSISDVQVVKGIGGGCDELAAQAVASSPNWFPAAHNEEIVRTRRIVPIKFEIK